ncbi:MAG: ornithine carbamoyltransferase [Verrucomicrobia bacterium]|nr:ornithine carbamoyltransferase [Verrucomicrobiota bacterium]
MLKLTHKHLLTGEELSAGEIKSLLSLASELKEKRKEGHATDILKGKHLALLFEKPSLRTRFSFTVAMHELGGNIVESLGETRKKEEPEDVARVVEGYCHAVMIRTHGDEILTRMGQVSKIPIINGLSDLHHPCQILADLLTLQEVFGTLEGLKLTYIGDGNNILHSLLLLAPLAGVHLHYCCPKACQPNANIVKQALKRADQAKGSITTHSTPIVAAGGAHAIYTDVWASMGFENKTNGSLFVDFQVNEELMEQALPEAIFMHCLPMIRGKEVSQTLPDKPASVIFLQSENRLHIQKALLVALMTKEGNSK